MKWTTIILILFLFSCNTKQKTEKQESCQDIDSINFELIKNSKDYRAFSEFVLNNPSSNYFFEAVKLYDKKRMEYYDSAGAPPPSECWRNCVSIDMNTNNKIAYEGMNISISTLHDSLLGFFINKNNLENLPEKKLVIDHDGKPHEISKGRVELQFVYDSCDYIQNVVLEINNSIESYKSYLSRNWYFKELDSLSKTNRDFIDSLMRYRLILYGFDKYYILPPPPPPNYKYENK